MDLFFQILIFIVSISILSWLSSRIVGTLVTVARHLHWKEFIIAFFVMAFAASLPNLFVDVNAAINGMPEVAFGDVLGGNLVDLTLIMAIAVLFSAGGVTAESQTVQKSGIFASLIVLLPILLIWDKALDRIDGVILLLAFGLYTWWLFSKEDRFKKTYRGRPPKTEKKWSYLVLNSLKIVGFLGLLLIASHFVVSSAEAFSNQFNISLSLVSIIIIGLGNCFPEAYFSIISARKGEAWLILGDLMGSIIVCTTLVLGLIALFFPFEIQDPSPFLITRVFTVVASLMFIVFIRTDKKVSKKEGLAFLSLYIVFLIVQFINS